MAKGTPLEGDRSAFDDTTFPNVHSKAVKDSIPQIHTPWPAAVGQVPVSDGDKWVAEDLERAIMTMGMVAGELTVAANPFRIYNLYSAARTILKVFISVNTAPTDDDIIVDVLINGTSIFALEADMPTILATEFTGYSVTFSTDVWDVDDYIQFEVLQIGSTLPGEDLTVQIISTS